MIELVETAYLCCVWEGKLWLPKPELPVVSAVDHPSIFAEGIVVGSFNDKQVIYIENNQFFPKEEFVSVRSLLHIEKELFYLASRAVQISYLRHYKHFCSLCGAEGQFDTQHLVMSCTSCNEIHYPQISPCVIVAVVRNNQILLAQHHRHKAGMCTVLAGFVEVGETLEQAVMREVKEESGIEVTNIRYFGSQPWAFPSNLMIGFIADYAGGEICIDRNELIHAAWYDLTALPDIPEVGTIARELIDTVSNNLRATE